MNLEAALAELPPQEPPRLRDWYDQVARLGCLVTSDPTPTLHHIHSGSCADAGYNRGLSQRGLHPFLVIPLRADLHCVGGTAIDGSIGVRTWESRFGSQVSMMDEVCRRTGVNAWAIAGIGRDPWARHNYEQSTT